MLGEQYVDEETRGNYSTLPTIPSIVQVAVGVDARYDDLPQTVTGITFATDPCLEIGGRRQNWLTVQSYAFDPTLSPEGKTVFKVVMTSDYEYWKSLQVDGARYSEEKSRAAEDVIAQLDRRFPGLAERVEMTDVATPVTFERYTGNWRGAYMGWLVTPETFGMLMKKKLPGLGRFYMAGQWVEPGGGLPTVVKSGRNVMQLICKEDGRPFVAGRP
jgi:phytoene dehydrogenase-like protein